MLPERGPRVKTEQPEAEYALGRADQIAVIRLSVIFAVGAVVTSKGLQQYPLDISGEYAKKIESDENHDPMTEGITKILESTPKGKTREVFIVPQRSFTRLAIRPIPGNLPDVELIRLKYGDSIILGMSMFTSYTYALLQGLIAECENSMRKEGINWKALGLSSRTLVKKALRRIAAENGTEKEVGKRLVEEYLSNHKDEWKLIEPADDSDTPQASEDDAKTP